VKQVFLSNCDFYMDMMSVICSGLCTDYLQLA